MKIFFPLLWTVSVFPLVLNTLTVQAYEEKDVYPIRMEKLNKTKPVWLITGATGRTGTLTYKFFEQESAFEVRGLVRNLTKANQLLDCGACSELEGIYLGDVTSRKTLSKPMKNIHGLVILTSSVPIGRYPFFHFPKGEKPVDVDYYGALNQVKVAVANGVKHIILVSTMGTTEPSKMLGHIGFYKLNAEAFLMASLTPFTIIKPGGLSDTEKVENSALQVGHQDILPITKPGAQLISRKQVAELVFNAAKMPDFSVNTRFDVATDPDTPAPETTDYQKVFQDAKSILSATRFAFKIGVNEQ